MILDPADPVVAHWLNARSGKLTARQQRQAEIRLQREQERLQREQQRQREEERLQRERERERAERRCRQQRDYRARVAAAAAAKAKPTTGIYATTIRRPHSYWIEVLRQSAARRRLDRQLLAAKA